MTIEREKTQVITGRIDIEMLHRRFEAHEARIGVIGLGYVGLPLVLAAVRRGARDVADVGASFVERFDLFAIDIEAPHLKRASSLFGALLGSA